MKRTGNGMYTKNKAQSILEYLLWMMGLFALGGAMITGLNTGIHKGLENAEEEIGSMVEGTQPSGDVDLDGPDPVEE